VIRGRPDGQHPLLKQEVAASLHQLVRPDDHSSAVAVMKQDYGLSSKGVTSSSLVQTPGNRDVR